MNQPPVQFAATLGFDAIGLCIVPMVVLMTSRCFASCRNRCTNAAAEHGVEGHSRHDVVHNVMSPVEKIVGLSDESVLRVDQMTV